MLLTIGLEVVKGEDVREHYQSFGWGLIQWCSKISQNLETLVLHELDRPYGEIMHLLRRCPNLKHLHLKLVETGQKLLILYTNLFFINRFCHLNTDVF